MIHRLVANKTKRSFIDPSPENDVFVHITCLETLLCSKIEKLKSPRLCFQSNNGFGKVHYRAVCPNRPPDDIVQIIEVYDDGLRGRR